MKTQNILNSIKSIGGVLMICCLVHTVSAQKFNPFKSSPDPGILADTYEFDWRYTLKMEHKKGDFKFHYYLKKDADYFGSLAEMENVKIMNGMFMVHDNALNTMTVFMDNDNGKTAQVVANPNVSEQPEQDMSEFTMKKLPSKTILGFECRGYQMESEDFKITSYVLMDAPVSFNNAGIAIQNQQNMPRGFDPDWLNNSGDALVMEMHFEHKKKKRLKGSMVCTALEKEPLTINVREYEFPQEEMMNRLKLQLGNNN